jgi:hypothetical protein
VSALQQLKEGLAVIKKRLLAMEELAEKASRPEYNHERVAEMQGQLTEIIESIKHAAVNTADKCKRLSIGECAKTSLAAGDGSQIDIFAKDLTFGATGVDLTSEASAVKSAVAEAIKELLEYGGYFDDQMTLLQERTERIEQEMVLVMGVAASEFIPDLGDEAASDIAEQIAAEAPGSIVMRGHVDPDKTLQLLQEARAQTCPEDTAGHKQSAAVERTVDGVVKVGRETDDTPNKRSERADIGT